MSSISETDVVDSSLSLEMQLQAWKRLASELQSELNDSSSADVGMSVSESPDILEEMESEESPKVQHPQQKSNKGKAGDSKMVVLSETDRFKVPKNKGSGGGRKRYHEAYLAEQEEENSQRSSAATSRELTAGSEEAAHSSKRAKSNGIRGGQKQADATVSKSKAAPPQSRKKNINNKK